MSENYKEPYNDGWKDGRTFTLKQFLQFLQDEEEACERESPYADELSNQGYNAAISYIKGRVRRWV